MPVFQQQVAFRDFQRLVQRRQQLLQPFHGGGTVAQRRGGGRRARQVVQKVQLQPTQPVGFAQPGQRIHQKFPHGGHADVQNARPQEVVHGDHPVAEIRKMRIVHSHERQRKPQRRGDAVLLCLGRERRHVGEFVPVRQPRAAGGIVPRAGAGIAPAVVHDRRPEANLRDQGQFLFQYVLRGVLVAGVPGGEQGSGAGVRGRGAVTRRVEAFPPRAHVAHALRQVAAAFVNAQVKGELFGGRGFLLKNPRAQIQRFPLGKVVDAYAELRFAYGF